MKTQLQSCFWFFIVLTVVTSLLFAAGACGGSGSEELPFWLRPQANYYEAKVVEMTLPKTVRQGESPEISARFLMSEKMASLLQEKGYAALFPVGPLEFPAPPGQSLLFSVFVLYSRYSDDTKDTEVDAVFPGFLKPYFRDVPPHVSQEPLARDLSPGTYNVYARVPTEMQDDPIRFFGSFEVLPAEQ
ncbi:MAG: hypothetical protein HRF49_03365 [bacterium]|jgi:hypothetical protein